MKTGEDLECHKQSLVGDSSGSSKDQNADRNVDGTESAHDISEENKGSIIKENKAIRVIFSQIICLYFPISCDFAQI